MILRYDWEMISDIYSITLFVIIFTLNMYIIIHDPLVIVS